MRTLGPSMGTLQDLISRHLGEFSPDMCRNNLECESLPGNLPASPSHPFSSDFKLCHASPHFPFDFTAQEAARGRLASGDVCRVRIKGKEFAPEKNAMATTAPAEAFIRCN